MQRLFATFPSGAPGFGLLLLRLALSGIVVLHAPPLSAMQAHWVQMLVYWCFAGLLTAGFLTPINAMACSLAGGIHLLLAQDALMTEDVCIVLAIMALGLIGAGAYSIDARIYGRRQIMLPFKPDE